MTSPAIFVCYSRQDVEWKDRLVRQLGAIGQTGIFAWHDFDLEPGDDYRRRILETIDGAAIGLLLVSDHSLSSTFIQSVELPRLLERRAQGSLRLIPLIVRTCAWQALDWLAALEVRPKSGRPLTELSTTAADALLAELALEIHRLLKPSTAGDATSPLAIPAEVSLNRLAPTGRELFGRDGSVATLDEAWANPQINVASVTSWAGTGKSALVGHWLRRMRFNGYRGAERVFGWSFENQGTSQTENSERFLSAALSWFDDRRDHADSGMDKADQLVNRMRRTRTLLVLDGVDSMQYPFGDKEGELRDLSMHSLICGLAEQNPGLCVLTTRLPVRDIAPYEPEPALRIELPALEIEAGVALLQALGVKGSPAELEAAVVEFDGHSLALTLLGSYLVDAFGGDIRQRTRIAALQGDVRHGAQARRVMESYEHWFGNGPEIALLSLLALFDRAVEEQTLIALCRGPVIDELTTDLSRLTPIEWRQLIGRLQRSKLLFSKPLESPAELSPSLSSLMESRGVLLNVQPLVREHFRNKLKNNAAVWVRINQRIFDYCRKAAPELPDTLDAMMPLYDAVRHGCWAGDYQAAIEHVYWPRIRRRNAGFSTRTLGAYNTDLSALEAFFDTSGRPAEGVPRNWHAPLLGWSGYRLYAVGRLADAQHQLGNAFDALLETEQWTSAVQVAANLALVQIAAGNFAAALASTDKILEVQRRRHSPLTGHVERLACHALILLERGCLDEAVATCRDSNGDALLGSLSTVLERLPIKFAFWFACAYIERGDFVFPVERLRLTRRDSESMFGDEDEEGMITRYVSSSGINLLDPRDSGLMLDDPGEFPEGSLLADRSDNLRADDDFLLTPLEEDDSTDDHGSRVIALDSNPDIGSLLAGNVPGLGGDGTESSPVAKHSPHESPKPEPLWTALKKWFARLRPSKTAEAEPPALSLRADATTVAGDSKRSPASDADDGISEKPSVSPPNEAASPTPQPPDPSSATKETGSDVKLPSDSQDEAIPDLSHASVCLSLNTSEQEAVPQLDSALKRLLKLYADLLRWEKSGSPARMEPPSDVSLEPRRETDTKLPTENSLAPISDPSLDPSSDSDFNLSSDSFPPVPSDASLDPSEDSGLSLVGSDCFSPSDLTRELPEESAAKLRSALDQMISELRTMGFVEYFSFALLTSARFHRFVGDTSLAERELDEAVEMTSRCRLNLCLVDSLLERVRLYVRLERFDDAAQTLARAEQLVKQIGYGRRNGEIDALRQTVSRPG